MVDKDDDSLARPPKSLQSEKEWWQNLGMFIPKKLVYKVFGTSDTSFRFEMKKAGISINTNRYFTPPEFEEICRKLWVPESGKDAILDYIQSRLRR